MLTPPSAYRDAVLRCPVEHERERNEVAHRKEVQLLRRMAQDRARSVSERREKIVEAKRERDSYISNVRALFKMNEVGGPPASCRSSCSSAVPGTRPKIPPVPKAPVLKAQHPVERDKVARSLRSARPAWSEASTAAPSTAGADDDESYDSPSRGEEAVRQATEHDVSPALRRSLEVWLREQESLSTVADQQHVAQTVGVEVQRAEDGQAPAQLEQNRRASAQECSERQSAECRGRKSASQEPPSSRLQAPRTGPPPQSLRAVTQEEHALEQSLLRLDFEEMKRQFAGKDPLWRSEPLEATQPPTDMTNTQREEKLQASLRRLDVAVAAAHDKEEARQADEEAARLEMEAELHRVKAAAAVAVAGPRKSRQPPPFPTKRQPRARSCGPQEQQHPRVQAALAAMPAAKGGGAARRAHTPQARR